MSVWEQWYIYVGTPILAGIFSFMALCTIQFAWNQLRMVPLPSRVIRNGINPDEMESLAEQGKSVLISGPAWIGQQGFTARVVLILGRNSEGFTKGWVFCHRYDKPEEFSNEGLKRIDDSKENNPVVYEPWYYDVCAEVDFSVIEEDRPEEIQELVDWALGDDPKNWDRIRKHLAKVASTT